MKAFAGARILVVDDERLVRRGLVQALSENGFRVEEAATASEAHKALAGEPPELLLLDYKLPDQTGVEVLHHLRRTGMRVPVVMITAHASIGGAVEAMKEGAYDYLPKPFEVDDLLRTVVRALEASRLRDEVAMRRAEACRDGALDQLAVESPAMRDVVRMVRRVAQSEASTVLLLGESGVGKGVIARALHLEGSLHDRPFMNITCTALAESLLESELFGHERGAFTDARAQKKGLFELANSGTVFLDEIGDLSPSLQGKLLRVLEDKTFRRVGGTHDIRVSARIIAATNKDLAAEVEAGRFRRDLYYRLNVIPIEIPPLRRRVEDIVPLAKLFVERFNREFGKRVAGIELDAQALLRSHPWAGNVRELRNAVERAVLLGESERLTVQDLPAELRARAAAPEPTPGARPGKPDAWTLPAQGIVLEHLERDLVTQALAQAQGNRSKAARLLGMNRDQIRYRIEKFGLPDS